MIRLFTSFYNEKNPIRKQELITCLQKNVSNELIERIYVIIEADTVTPFYDSKIIYIRSERPTFEAFFKLVNWTAIENDISIVANSDIYFDSTLSLIQLKEDQCYALSRYEIAKNGSIEFLQGQGWSQDSWIFKGKIKAVEFSDFYAGKIASDNRIAHELREAGYQIYNVAKTIKSYHLHEGAQRNYANADKSLKVAPPYLLLPVGTVDEAKRNVVRIQSRPISFE